MGRPPAQRYAAAVLVVAGAVLLRAALVPVTQQMYPFFTAYGAVVVSGWLLGAGPALLTLVLCYFTHLLLFIQPRGLLWPTTTPHIAGTVMYAFTGLVVCLLAQARARAEVAYVRGQHESRTALNTLRALLDSIPEGIVIIDMPGGVVRLISRAGAEMGGFHAPQVQGRSLYELARTWRAIDPVSGDAIPHTDRPFVRMLEKGEPILDRELVVERPDGSRIPVLLNGAPIFDRTCFGPDGKPLIIGGVMVYRDITRRKQAMAALAESAARYRLLFEQAPWPKWLVHMETLRFLDVNDAAIECFGYTREEFLSRTLADLRSPDAPPTELEQRHDKADHFEGTIATRQVTRTGTVLDVELTAREIPVRHDGPHDGAEDGGILLVECFDTTDLKHAQQELLRKAAELERSNADLEQFAHAAAHDLKEPLRGLALYASFLLEDHGESLPEEGRRMVHTISRLASRGIALVDSLLEVSQAGRTQLRLAEVDLNRLLADVLEGLTRLIDEQEVIVSRTCELPTLTCDRVQVARILTNLITNAIKYNTSRPKRVEVGCEPHPRVGGQLAMFVRDNGIGIKPEHQQQIFRMFRRLHTPDAYGGGTGAGLALVQKLVRRHAGEVWVESEPGNGATFWFTLGTPTQPATPPPVMPPEKPPPARR